MADISPEEAEHNRRAAAAAANEDSGYSVDGDTPPAEGIGVGPTNHQPDSDGPSGGALKVILTILAVLFVVFIVLAIAGRVIGFF